MKKLRVGINGFGRIGRIAARIILQRNDIELAAINSRADSASHAYLLKYDSTYGTLTQDIKPDKESLLINGEKVSVFQSETPAEIPWDSVDVDIVIDATGKYRTTPELEQHLRGSVRKVILSAPAKDDTKTIVLGVNDSNFDSDKDTIISNSSCTTNCLSTTLKVLNDSFGVLDGFMTTVHAVTDSQNILDNSHRKEARLRRAAFASMIPASTGSAKDIGKILPQLSGKIVCQAIRVPLQTVSMIILSVHMNKQVTIDGINTAFLKASTDHLKGILAITGDELVSKDFSGNVHSSIVDTYLTKVIQPNFATIYAWYDNEYGYTSRLVDMVSFVGQKIS